MSITLRQRQRLAVCKRTGTVRRSRCWTTKQYSRCIWSTEYCYELTANPINHLTARFGNTEKMEFLAYWIGRQQTEVSTVPEGEFDAAVVKNELMVLYGSEDWEEVLHSLRGTFEQTYKLANLISTVPATAASAFIPLNDKTDRVTSHSCLQRRPQLQSWRGCWKNYIIQEKSGIPFQMTEIYKERILDLISRLL